PSPRRDHSAIYLGNGQVLLFGGEDSSGRLGDTWIYDISSQNWQYQAVSGPPRRRQAVLYYDSAAGAAILFGGRSGETYYNDFWIFENGSWRQIYPVYDSNYPPGRASASAAFSSELGLSVIFGGSYAAGTEYLGDTWTHSLSTAGIYDSPVFDAGQIDTSLQYLDIDWSTSGVDGAVSFQVASSSAGDPEAFTGPDGSTGTFYSTPGAIESSHGGKRYFSYRFFLESPVAASNDPLTVISASVTYNHSPGLPSHIGKPLASAEDGGITNERPTRFYWDNALDNDGDGLTYRLIASTSADFTNIIAENSPIAEEDTRTWGDLTLDHGGPYYWKVRANDGTAYGDYTEPWTIYIDTVPPASVTSLAAVRHQDLNGAVKLEWTSPGPGYLYRIRWSEVWQINSETRWQQAESEEALYYPSTQVAGETETAVISGLADGTTFFFNVRLQDEAGNLSSLSPSTPAKTNSPAEITLLSALSGQWGTATEKESPYITFKWSLYDPDPEDSHEVDIMLADGAGEPFDITVATALAVSEYSWDSRNVLNNSNYVAKIIGRDQRGLEGSVATGPVSVINYNEPPEVTLLSPAGGEYWENIQYIDWDWNDPNKTDTVYFRIYISTDGGSSYSYEDKYLQEDEIPYAWGTGNFPDSDRTVVKVEAVDNRGLTGAALSGFIEINNSSRPPEPFSLTHPIGGAFIYTTSPSLEWEASSDPDGGEITYTVTISTLQDFFPAQEYDGSTENYLQGLVLEDEKAYWWKVTALDDKLVRRESSSVGKFTVDINPPEVLEVWPPDGEWLVMTGTETLTVRLNKDPGPEVIIANHITVTDNYENIGRVSFHYLPGAHTINIYPSSGWSFLPSRRYSVKIGPGLTDKVGHPVSNMESFSFVNMLSSGSSTTIEYPGVAVLDIKKGTLKEKAFVYLDRPDSAARESAAEADLAAIPEKNKGDESVKSIQLKAYNSKSEPINNFSGDAELQFLYEDDGAGFVEGIEIDENYLGIYSLESSPSVSSLGAMRVSSKWSYLESRGDYEINSVKASVAGPGVYSLRAYTIPEKEISGVVIYPNPFTPAEHGKVNVKFILTEDSEITFELYTLTGDLVYREEKNFTGSVWGEANSFTWDGKNGAGREAANGMYAGRLIKSGDVKEKFMIGVLK
ncbi:MAG: kelch repeat-containing protein, partial [Elusimicrobiota bacterium]|nr:kelch repeat-containing protein [Elusimicrobiota bacterium]